MNIFGIDQNYRVAQGMSAASPTRTNAAGQTGEPIRGDGVHMSALARLMSRQPEALFRLHRPRPDMVQKFRDQGLPDAIPDTAVDAIFRRLVEA